eukprot:jgi/Mesvir1/13100/Mv06080-RA.1
MNRVWAVDPFYSAADDVQDASDRLQERFRLWQSRRRGGQIEKKEGSEDGILDDECTERELIAACDSIEWQLDEFDKVIKVTSLAPDTFHVSEEELARRRQFVAALRFLVSGVRRTLANATAMAHESRVAAERDADRASPDSSAASPSWADGAVRPVRREGPSAGSGGAGEHDMARLGAFLGVEMRDGGERLGRASGGTASRWRRQRPRTLRRRSGWRRCGRCRTCSSRRCCCSRGARAGRTCTWTWRWSTHTRRRTASSGARCRGQRSSLFVACAQLHPSTAFSWPWSSCWAWPRQGSRPTIMGPWKPLEFV